MGAKQSKEIEKKAVTFEQNENNPLEVQVNPKPVLAEPQEVPQDKPESNKVKEDPLEEVKVESGAPIETRLLQVTCPCCATLLTIDVPKAEIVTQNLATQYTADGAIPSSFFKSDFNTQTWVNGSPKAKRDLGLPDNIFL